MFCHSYAPCQLCLWGDHLPRKNRNTIDIIKKYHYYSITGGGGGTPLDDHEDVDDDVDDDIYIWPW